MYTITKYNVNAMTIGCVQSRKGREKHLDIRFPKELWLASAAVLNLLLPVSFRKWFAL